MWLFNFENSNTSNSYFMLGVPIIVLGLMTLPARQQMQAYDGTQDVDGHGTTMLCTSRLVGRTSKPYGQIIEDTKLEALSWASLSFAALMLFSMAVGYKLRRIMSDMSMAGKATAFMYTITSLAAAAVIIWTVAVEMLTIMTTTHCKQITNGQESETDVVTTLKLTYIVMCLVLIVPTTVAVYKYGDAQNPSANNLVVVPAAATAALAICYGLIASYLQNEDDHCNDKSAHQTTITLAIFASVACGLSSALCMYIMLKGDNAKSGDILDKLGEFAEHKFAGLLLIFTWIFYLFMGLNALSRHNCSENEDIFRHVKLSGVLIASFVISCFLIVDEKFVHLAVSFWEKAY